MRRSNHPWYIHMLNEAHQGISSRGYLSYGKAPGVRDLPWMCLIKPLRRLKTNAIFLGRFYKRNWICQELKKKTATVKIKRTLG